MSAIPLSGVGGAPFGVGAAIGKAFGVFARGWWKFFVLTLIPLAPYYLYDFVTQPTTLAGIQAAQTQGATYFAGLGLRIVIAMALQALANATCLYGAYQIMRGKDFSIGESLSAGLSRVTLAIGTSLAVAVLVYVGFILLFVPGVIVMLMMYVALPVCVVERLGPFASMGRSRFLTKGARWKLLGMLLLMFLAIAVLGAIFGGIGGYVGGLVGYKIGAMPVTIFVYAFFSVLAAVVYHDLRVSKEGVDVETLAGVFD